jgi:hypothetical protein
MARTDDFRLNRDDGFRYSVPERDQERRDREAGYLLLALVVVVVMLATATGRITIFYY